jgi:formylglycine-generating enzyme required for sulfatase activity
MPAGVAKGFPQKLNFTERLSEGRMELSPLIRGATAVLASATATLHFTAWSPTPVGSSPAGGSRWGVGELVDNGWEWTDTPFVPFPGFAPYMTSYPDYSKDFFDGKHFVLKGASWATAAELLRPSFRNWYQAHYPYVFAKFRCAFSDTNRSGNIP